MSEEVCKYVELILHPCNTENQEEYRLHTITVAKYDAGTLILKLKHTLNFNLIGIDFLG